jgi:thiol-disulfide isomerase/thioredoxin
MDRLPALTLACTLVLLGLGCTDRSAPPSPPASRVDSVKGPARRGPSLEEFCDKRHDAAGAPAFVMPAVTGAAPPAANGWRWINLWATWCKPCVAEVPRLQEWTGRLGGRVTLELVSVDEHSEVVEAFRKQHPGIPSGPRLANLAQLPAVLKSLGLDEGAPIPIHVFVDPKGRTRCVRAGAVNEADFAVVERIIAE